MLPLQFKNKIKLYIHIFPSTEYDWDCLKHDTDGKYLYVRHLFEYHSSLNAKVIPKFWCFKTDRIFSNCCQSEVYKCVVEKMIDQVYLGIDNVVMSYGQNVSGKTFTMTGLYNQYELRGIIPRFIVDLFSQSKFKQDDFTTHLWMSAVDIHNNVIYDLLTNSRRTCKDVKQVKKVQLHSELQCLELLFKAEAKRLIVDQKSYNAHAASNIVTFTIKLTSLNNHEPYNKFSKVHFIDLAGVETIGRNPLTSIKDHRNQGYANVTKSLLEVFAVRYKNSNDLQKSNFQVNKRTNTITQYLDKSLSPTSCIKLICHIRPNHEDLMITLSLLKFATTFQGIPMVKPEPYIEQNHEMILENLQEQLKSLQDELIIRNLWVKQCPMNISQGRIDFVKRAVESFMKGDISEYELYSMVDDCSLILNIMKSSLQDKQPSLNETAASQTDDQSLFTTELAHENIENDPSGTENQSTNKGKLSPFDLKHVSFSKTKDLNKMDKTTKSKKKGNEKSKGEETPESKSEEVQVNLIEPNAKMPNVGSRENIWATFLISRPDIQVRLDKFNMAVVGKEKKVNIEKLKSEDVNQSLNKIQLALNQLVGLRHFEGKEVYDKEGRLVVSQEETNLVKELQCIQKEAEICKQRLTDAQIEWLEALEKMDGEKQVIEEEFKQYCLINSLLILKQDTVSQKQSVIQQPSESQLIKIIDYCEIQEMLYDNLQKKYLNSA